MNITELLLNLHECTAGDFDHLEKFRFEGVYIICDSNNEIVYIGSAYARTIEIRLKQYISATDSGNTLGKTIAKN